MTMTETARRPVLKHGRKYPNPRSVWLWGFDPLPHTLHGITPIGQAGQAGQVDCWIYPDGNNIAAILRSCACAGPNRPDILLMVGSHLSRADVNAAAAAGWIVTHYRSNLHSATFSQHGYSVDVRDASVWFGAETDVATIRAAWVSLRLLLATEFGESAYLWPSPTMTGLELLRASLPFHRDYPVLPIDLLELLISNNGQGRIELLTDGDGPHAGRTAPLPDLYNLDGRWMYASCLHHLPSGPYELAQWDNAKPAQPGDVGYEASFYHFAATVPAEWRHIGLLPCRQDGQTVYPWRPGESFQGWATGAEIQVALNHGWRIHILEALTWPKPDSDPAGLWIRKMRALRDAAQKHNDAVHAAIAYALRAIVLGTIGAWHRVTTLDEGYAPYGTEMFAIPVGAVPRPADDGWEWKRELLTIGEWSHPEWSATVWGRARAKLAAQALAHPLSSLVALRTDAVWLDSDPSPRVVDTGKPGGWRVKRHIAGPLSVPRDNTALLALLDESGDE